ncbi:MAG: GIY-YIG nuclease family protein [Opitutaceae bacterium]|nr:GIY-YIG nuclease family protein [Opitutaceae bacterium]
MNNYYVYVYVDPRNFEEFYYGKGRGSRKSAHLVDASESPKTKRISSIRMCGLEPIVRVIAKDLTEDQALLIEATLLWKLGKFTTNMAAGHFSGNFRPHDTMHKELPGFDFQNRLYYFNVGDGTHRRWEDCRKMGFISAGQGVRWRDAICGFKCGDVFAAYFKNRGFVGIGKIRIEARMVREVFIGTQPLVSLCPRMAANCDSADLSEYVAMVDWIQQVPSSEAKFKKKSGIYTTTHVRASLDGQPATVDFLASAFDVDFRKILA